MKNCPFEELRRRCREPLPRESDIIAMLQETSQQQEDTTLLEAFNEVWEQHAPSELQPLPPEVALLHILSLKRRGKP